MSPEGRKAENYVPPLFFEKAGDKKYTASIECLIYSCVSCNGEVIKYHGHRTVLVIYLLVRNISGRVKSLNTWPECQAKVCIMHMGYGI